MAIILPRERKAIFHPQKTGGTWVRGVLRVSQVPHMLSFPQIDKTLFASNFTNRLASQHMPEEFPDDWTVATLVRDRESWEKSYHNARNNTTNPDEWGWGTCSLEVGAELTETNDLETFWNFVNKKYDCIAYDKYFDEYLCRSTVRINLSNIWEELKAFLPEYKLRQVMPMNVGVYT